MGQHIFDWFCKLADATCTTTHPDYSGPSWVPGLDRLLSVMYYWGWSD